MGWDGDGDGDGTSLPDKLQLCMKRIISQLEPNNIQDHKHKSRKEAEGLISREGLSVSNSHKGNQ